MKSKLIKELFIVCVSALCITIMTKGNSHIDNFTEEPTEKIIDAYIMTSDGREIGLVEDETIGDEAINLIKDTYLKSSDISGVKDVAIENDINYIKTTCNENEVLSETDLTNRIIHLNDTEDKNVITLTVLKSNEITEVPYSQVEKKEVKAGEEIAFSAKFDDQILYKEVFLDKSVCTPVKGVLTSPFGEQRSGYYHKGIDLAADTGTEIEAALDGVVTFSGYNGTYGNVVMIHHQNNMDTVYAHCSSLNVSEGDNVYKGQPIAEVGSTGDSTGPHLHFEIRIDGTPVDPLKYNKAGEY